MHSKVCRQLFQFKMLIATKGEDRSHAVSDELCSGIFAILFVRRDRVAIKTSSSPATLPFKMRSDSSRAKNAQA